MKAKYLKEVLIPTVTNQEIPDDYEVLVKMYENDHGYKVEGVTVDHETKKVNIILL